MGKTKNKNKSSEEYYRGEIRKLKKEVQQLRKQLNQKLPTQEIEESVDSEDTHPTIYKHTKTCECCGKGKIRQFEIIGRMFEECDICEYRKKLGQL